MKPLWRGAALGAAAFLLFVIVNAPAAWIVARVAQQVPGVVFSGVSGSVWTGAAAQVRTDSVALSDVRWHWHPSALLSGRVEYGLSGQWGGNPVSLAAGRSLFGGSYLADVAVAAPAPSWIAALRLPAEAAGQVELALDRVEFVDGAAMPLLTGGAHWRPATISAPVALGLGTVTLELAPEGALSRGRVSAQEGALLVDGTVEIGSAGDYSLVADLTPTARTSRDIRTGLDTIAELRGGRYHLEWKDSLN